MTTFAKITAFFLSYKFLISELVKRDISEKTSGTMLGFFWLVAQPLCIIAILMTSFSSSLRSNVSSNLNPPSVMIMLYIVWYLFIQTVSFSLPMYRLNKAFLSQIDFPPVIIAIKSVTSSYLINFSLYLFVSAFFLINQSIDLYSFLLCLLFYVLLFPVLFALCNTMSLFSLFVKDIEQAVPIIIFLNIYLLPIFYKEAQAPGFIALLIKLNPMSILIRPFAASLGSSDLFDTIYLSSFWFISFSILVCCFSWYLHDKLSSSIHELI